MDKSIFSFLHGYHDANLSVCVDGRIITLELERLFGNRYFAFEFAEDRIDVTMLLEYIKEILKREGLFCSSYDIGLFDWVTPHSTVQLFKDFFNIDKIHHEDDITSHHKAHAAGAFFTSGFNQALVVSHDGGGNDGTFCVFDVDRSDPNFTQINEKIDNPFSTKYCTIGRCIEDIRPPQNGVIRQMLQPISHPAGVNSAAHQRLHQIDQGVAGKLMGLAAYGSYDQELFDRCMHYYRTPAPSANPYNVSFWENFGEFATKGVSGERAFDLAFNAQLAFEEYFLELFLNYFNHKKHKNVCLTGGGALNVVLNERLSKTYPSTRFFIPSSPGDSGLSYGMIAHYLKNGIIGETMYAGCGVLDEGVLPSILDGRPWEKATPSLIAKELASGKIIGVCRGASETGPRALGNRSILADPRSHRAKEFLNNKVKFREWYRPFAPVCKQESAPLFFETSGNALYHYMSFSPQVREEYRATLPAVTHIDGSSRLQTISEDQNPFLYDVLDEFEKESGMPILINTSFNTRGNAILTRYLTALQVLDTTGLDSVILGDYYISK